MRGGPEYPSLLDGRSDLGPAATEDVSVSPDDQLPGAAIAQSEEEGTYDDPGNGEQSRRVP